MRSGPFTSISGDEINIYGGDAAVTVSLRGMNAARAALRYFDVQLQEEVKAIANEYGAETRDLIQLFAPFRTGFMQEHAEYQLSPKGYSFEAGFFADTFMQQLAEWGMRPRFYPPYQEYGTVHHGAQPSVGPAFDDAAPRFQNEITALIRKSCDGYGVTQ